MLFSPPLKHTVDRKLNKGKPNIVKLSEDFLVLLVLCSTWYNFYSTMSFGLPLFGLYIKLR